MENRNNFQLSSHPSNTIPRPDPNPTPTINPNETPQFNQAPLHTNSNIQTDDIELHELFKASLWPLNLPSDQFLNHKHAPFIFPNPDLNPTPPSSIEMLRLDQTDNIAFHQSLMTMPSALDSTPSLPQTQTMSCSSFFDDNVVDRFALDLTDMINSFFNNEMHLAAATSSSTEIPPPCNEAVDATQGVVNSSNKKKKWSLQEHKLLLVGMEIYGKGEWKKIANNVVITKTYKQVASHAQKYFLRQCNEKKRASIHDNNNVDRKLLSQVRARLGLQQKML